MTKSFIGRVKQFYNDEQQNIPHGTAFDAWCLAPNMAKKIIAIDDALGDFAHNTSQCVRDIRKIIEED